MDMNIIALGIPFFGTLYFSFFLYSAIHEGGHYVAARSLSFRVTRFCFGPSTGGLAWEEGKGFRFLGFKHHAHIDGPDMSGRGLAVVIGAGAFANTLTAISCLVAAFFLENNALQWALLGAWRNFGMELVNSPLAAFLFTSILAHSIGSANLLPFKVFGAESDGWLLRQIWRGEKIK